MDVNWNYDAKTQRFNLDVGFMTPERLRKLAFAQISDDNFDLAAEVTWPELAGMLLFELVSYVSSRDVDWWTLSIYSTAFALYVFSRAKTVFQGLLAATICAAYSAIVFAIVGLDARWLFIAVFLGAEIRILTNSLTSIYVRQSDAVNALSARLYSLESLTREGGKVLREAEERKRAKEHGVTMFKVTRDATDEDLLAMHNIHMEHRRKKGLPVATDDDPDDPAGPSEPDEALPPEESTASNGSAVTVPRNDLYSIAREKQFQQ